MMVMNRQMSCDEHTMDETTETEDADQNYNSVIPTNQTTSFLRNSNNNLAINNNNFAHSQTSLTPEHPLVLPPIKITALYISELAYLIDPKTKKPAKYDCPHCSKPICPKKGKQHITLDRSCKSCVEYDYCSHCTIRANQWRGKITMLYQHASTVPIDFIFVDATAGCDHRIRCEKCGHYKFCFSSHSCKKKDFHPLASSFDFTSNSNNSNNSNSNSNSNSGNNSNSHTPTGTPSPPHLSPSSSNSSFFPQSTFESISQHYNNSPPNVNNNSGNNNNSSLSNSGNNNNNNLLSNESLSATLLNVLSNSNNSINSSSSNNNILLNSLTSSQPILQNENDINNHNHNNNNNNANCSNNNLNVNNNLNLPNISNNGNNSSSSNLAIASLSNLLKSSNGLDFASSLNSILSSLANSQNLQNHLSLNNSGNSINNSNNNLVNNSSNNNNNNNLRSDSFSNFDISSTSSYSSTSSPYNSSSSPYDSSLYSTDSPLQSNSLLLSSFLSPFPIPPSPLKEEPFHHNQSNDQINDTNNSLTGTCMVENKNIANNNNNNLNDSSNLIQNFNISNLLLNSLSNSGHNSIIPNNNNNNIIANNLELMNDEQQHHHHYNLESNPNSSIINSDAYNPYQSNYLMNDIINLSNSNSNILETTTNNNSITGYSLINSLNFQNAGLNNASNSNNNNNNINSQLQQFNQSQIIVDHQNAPKNSIELLWRTTFGPSNEVDKYTFSRFISIFHLDGFQWEILRTTSLVEIDDVFKESTFEDWFQRLGPTNPDYANPDKCWSYFLFRVSQVAAAILECAKIQTHFLTILKTRSHPDLIVLSWNPGNNEHEKRFRIKCTESGFRLFKDPLMRSYAYQDQSLVKIIHKFIAEHSSFNSNNTNINNNNNNNININSNLL